MSSWVAKLQKRWSYLTKKCTLLPKLLFTWEMSEAKMLLNDFIISFGIRDIFFVICNKIGAHNMRKVAYLLPV